MTTEAVTKLPDGHEVHFNTLDADTLRTSLIGRYARMLYGELTRNKLDPCISVGQTVNGVAFTDPAEQAHLQDRVKSALEDYQDRRKGERWKSLYSIQKITVTVMSDYLNIQVSTTTVRPF